MCRVTRLHTRLHRISNVDLRTRIGLSLIDAYVTRRQLNWLGHVVRMNPKRLPRKMLTSWVREKRPRGAPDYTYGRGVYKALKKVNVGRNEWYECAQDRIGWRGIVNRAI